MRLSTLLTGEYDHNNAILSLNAGAGGARSCDWCSMLDFRMYSKWADRKGFTVDVMNVVDGDEAGYKSVDFESRVRTPAAVAPSAACTVWCTLNPFNAQGKRQTSFVSCEVMPELDTTVNVDINPDDIESLPTGPRVPADSLNRTSRYDPNHPLPDRYRRHLPEQAIPVPEQGEGVRDPAHARLYLRRKEEEDEKLAGIRGDVKDSAFGSQIRSYVLQPYTLVKDTRTKEETSMPRAS